MLTAYVLISLQIAYWVWVDPAFCDTAEEACDTRSWDTSRVLRWGGWAALGLGVAAFSWFTLRHAPQPRAAYT